MRVFIIVLVLILNLQSWTKADDISDFEIEGMSIGDSLLDHFTKNEIVNNIRQYGYSDDNFYATGLTENFFKTYESIDIHLKRNDYRYIIYALDGLIFYEDINNCYKKMNTVENELSHEFTNSKKIVSGINKHWTDKSGKSTVKRTHWKLDSGDLVSVECYYWSEEIKKKYPRWSNHLRISLTKKELDDWLKQLD